MGLQKYHSKRDFSETSEPIGKKASKSKPTLQFCVQEHHASRLHWDFRLEVDGVLKSWAVPKGPPQDTTEKRLAIHVEDHPFDYLTFEGTIPKGSYGAGTVELWDIGVYEYEGAESREESEKLMRKGLHAGQLNIILHGKKLKGAYSLVRIKGQDDEDNDKQWLFLKKKTTLEYIKPMLATLVDEPFDSDDWIFEIKWDGYRALANIHHNEVTLYSRNFKSFNERFSEIVEDLKMSTEALIDGEIVVLDKEGNPSFSLMQNYQRNQEGNLVYMVFDILNLNGEDLTHLPLLERKKMLKKILPTSKKHVRYCDHVVGKGKAFFEAASKANLEGIIAKKADSPYLEGTRGADWLKIKTHMRQEAIICGFTEPRGSREKFGSLILGVYDKNGLTFVGHAGTGFDVKKLESIHKRLLPLVQKTCPFAKSPKLSNITWVKPKVVCEVKFAEWTNDGKMRQAVFIDLRDDKEATDVVKEKIVKASAKKNEATTLPILSHLDKVFWPKEGYTKGDLLEYYKAVSTLILPYLKDRPESFRRYPNGIKGSAFFQKNFINQPDWIHTEEIQHSDKKVQYIIIDDEKSLLYAVNLGCIDLNPFNSRIQSLHNPDYLIIDLDAKGVDFEYVIEVAQHFYKLLKKLDIPSFCKTSGATGMHIYIPTEALYTYEEVRDFASMLTMIIAHKLPDITSIERSPQKRKGKIYLDAFQNGFGQTVAAPYSVRPVEGACVSTPLKWTEVKKGLHPTNFTMKDVLSRFKKIGDIFKPVLGKGIDMKKVLAQLEKSQRL